MTQLTCFKAYDIRGKLGTELNEDIAYKIGLRNDKVVKAQKYRCIQDAKLMVSDMDDSVSIKQN